MLRRQITTLQAVSLNMAMMVGVGPFITIPLFVATLGGPHAMIGWVLGALIALCDGLVWSELASAFPGSGGTYHFYDAVHGDSRMGRGLRFLFVWQFLVSGPLELATGGIGIAQYAGYLFPWLAGPAWNFPLGEGLRWEVSRGQFLSVWIVLGFVALAYRRVEAAGKLMVVLWVGMLITMAWVIGTGFLHMDSARLTDVPPDAWTLDGRFAMGLGGALAIAMYDFLGYYQVCYLGDEVKSPERTLPLAILISVLAVSSMYLTMNLGILGVIPWPDVVASKHIASDFMERAVGGGAATLITCMILWTGGAALYAGLLSYSRVPYAAAVSGHFFRGLAATHVEGSFPHRSLLLVGVLTALSCLFDLPTVIAALLACRILIQFVGQILMLLTYRKSLAEQGRLRFRMPLYPLPPLIALTGWLWVFATTERKPLLFGIVSLAVGLAAFATWDRVAPRGEDQRRTD